MRCVRCKASEGGVRLCLDCRRELRDIQRDPAEVARLFEEGSGMVRIGDFAAAVRVFQKLLRRDEKNLGAYENLILAYGFVGRFDRAVTALAAMHRVTPPAAPPVVQPLPAEKKMSTRRRTKTAVPTEEAVPSREVAPMREVDLVSLGLFFRQLHQLELAEAVLKKALEEQPTLPEAQLVLGSVYRAKGRLRHALRHLKSAQGCGECAAVDYEMGMCHEGLGQLKRAHALVSRAVTLEPDNPHMHLTLGMLYEKLGRQRLARREYRVASSLNSAFAPALVDISFRLGVEAIEEGNLDRALQEFQAGVGENSALFAPGILAEIDHLLVQIIRGEQFRNFIEEYPALTRLPSSLLRGVEEGFATAARLGFYLGLTYYWDGYYDGSGSEASDSGEVYGPVEASEAWQYEPVEPEATWLEGPGPSGRIIRGATPSPWRRRRGGLESDSNEAAVDESGLVDETAAVRAEISRPETFLGFPPVPFEFIFEEWLNVHATLASPRIAERPLVSPDAYQRLLALLGACVRQVQYLLNRAEILSGASDEDTESFDGADLATSLWATIIESFLLRTALERCRGYSREFLVRFGVAERYRLRRFFARAIRELETALPLMPENASVHNFLWNLYIRESRFPEARDHCEAVLRFTPHYLFQAAAYNDLAYCMVEVGHDLNRALLYTEKARELAPRLFDAHVADTVAWLSWRQGKYDEALTLIEKVIEAGRAKDNPLAPTSIHFYHYGHILQSLGREREAQEAYATAMEMESDAESDWGVTRRLREEIGEE